MSTDPSTRLDALLAAAWRECMLDPRRAGEIGDQLARRAAAEGQPRLAAYGAFHRAFSAVRLAPLDEAGSAVEAVAAQAARDAIEPVLRLCDDARGVLAIRAGRFDEALALGQRNARLDAATRPAVERCLTLLVLHTACHQSARYDDALRYGYKHLALAEAMQDDGQRALAMNNVAAVQFNVFNVEDAKPLQEEAHAIWWRLRSRARLGMSTTNLIAVCDALGLHEQGVTTLDAWLNQPGGVDAVDLHHFNARIALALMGAGRLDEAEAALAAGPYRSMTDPRTECWWSWARGRLSLRQGRFAEARAVCQAYLDSRPARRAVDTPYDLVQLYEIVGEASEALGDHAAALEAAKLAHAASVPLVGSSARARYITMLIHDDLDGLDESPAAGGSHGRRLNALNRGVREYGQALAEEVAPAQAAAMSATASVAPASVGVASPSPSPSQWATGAGVGPPAAPHRFLAHVSHEMRAPLNGMLGMSSLLLLTDLDERQRRFASAAKTSAEVLLQLVNDILDLARIESGQFRFDPRPLSLEALGREVIDLFLPQAEAKGVSLLINVDPSLPGEVIGDSLRLRQVLTNLVGNAVKFTAEGRVSVTVFRPGFKAHDPPGGPCHLRFEVHDTGKGISAEAQARLFTEFMQEDDSIAREFGGTGLGLALCRQLVRAMGGTIGVRSQPGAGSLFWFEVALPLGGAPPGAAAELSG